MSVRQIVTRGYGTFGTIPAVVTRGYWPEGAVPPATTDHQGSGFAGATPVPKKDERRRQERKRLPDRRKPAERKTKPRRDVPAPIPTTGAALHVDPILAALGIAPGQEEALRASLLAEEAERQRLEDEARAILLLSSP